MGDEIGTAQFTREDYRRYQRKVRRCLDVLTRMLDSFPFDRDRSMAGFEIEVNLADGQARPAMCNDAVIAGLADPAFQTELGRFNLELNVPPRLLGGAGLTDFEAFIRDKLGRAQAVAQRHGADVVLVGILPTIGAKDAIMANISTDPRYRALNDQIMAVRGEDIVIDIRGHERLQLITDSIMPEAANTSVQFHLQLTPEMFPSYWNASQAVAAVQVAVGANSPYLFGRRLWDETRVALFEQATDTRPEVLRNQGVRPRVWFGERWITSVFDLFEENVRYFSVLLPRTDEEDPEEALASGRVPNFRELRLHNGTVYRWNRPVYDVSDGLPHLRVENRAMPAGPTVVDMMANAAFYFGLVRSLACADRPVWTQLPYGAAEQNFFTACREGLDATVFWPRYGEIRVVDLILERLLPAAHEGLAMFEVSDAVRERLLGVVERRCVTGRNGARWQTEMVNRLQRAGLDRQTALRQMLTRYVAHAQTQAPVHSWPLD